MELTVTSTDQLDKIAENFASRIKMLDVEVLKLCKEINNAIIAYPALKECLIKYGISSHKISTMQRVAAGYLHPTLLNASGRQYQVIKTLPYNVQERILTDDYVVVLTSDGSNLKVPIDCLTPDQVKQVFDKSGVRDIPAQKAYIESQKTQNMIKSASAKATKDGYEVVNDKKKKCVVFENFTGVIPAEDIAMWAAMFLTK